MAARLVWMILALVLTGCGEGVIPFGGDHDDDRGGDNITVTGNIRDIFVENALRDIVVFVYTDLSENALLPPASDQFVSVRTVVVSPSGSRQFTLTNVRRGTLTVVFLQDHATDPDGSIDCEDVTVMKPTTCPPDPNSTADENAVARLIKSNKLTDVRGGSSVTLNDVDVDFPSAMAEALDIVIAATPPAT